MKNVRGNRGTGLLVVSVLLCEACTSLRPIENDLSRGLGGHVAMGQRVRVSDTDGRRQRFTVTAVGEDYIEGHTADGRDVRFDLADLEEIELREPARGKTAALAAGLFVLYYVSVVGTAYGALLSGFL